MRFTKWAMLAVGAIDLGYALRHDGTNMAFVVGALGATMLAVVLRFWKKL